MKWETVGWTWYSYGNAGLEDNDKSETLFVIYSKWFMCVCVCVLGLKTLTNSSEYFVMHRNSNKL